MVKSNSDVNRCSAMSCNRLCIRKVDQVCPPIQPDIPADIRASFQRISSKRFASPSSTPQQLAAIGAESTASSATIPSQQKAFQAASSSLRSDFRLTLKVATI